MANYVTTFTRKTTISGTTYLPGSVATLADTVIAAQAAKQRCSVTNNTQNTTAPDAPKAVAAMIPSEWSVANS